MIALPSLRRRRNHSEGPGNEGSCFHALLLYVVLSNNVLRSRTQALVRQINSNLYVLSFVLDHRYGGNTPQRIVF